MNCEEYQQAVGADPGFTGGSEHLESCAACQSWRSDMLALEAKLQQALALEVPALVMPELPDLGADNVVTRLPQRQRMVPLWLAAAASILVAVFLGVRFLGNTAITPDALASEVLAHVNHEPSALNITDVPVPAEQLRDVVPANLAEMGSTTGLITFAATCPINGHNIPHLVVQGETGPITILLLPSEKIGSAIELDNDVNHGVILPVGDGSVAIIGSKQERLEQLQQRVVDAVRWRT